MKAAPLSLALCVAMTMPFFPYAGNAALTAEEVMTQVRQQLTTPAEFVLGEMKVYRGGRLNRSYSFVMGKLWDPQTQTETVRLDFATAINSAPDSSLYSHQRYLLKRVPQTLPSQWLYLPALRRVRITPYRPDDALLQSDYLFYELTAIHAFADYRYRFIDTNAQRPVIEGIPQTTFVPYLKTIFTLERRGTGYVMTEIWSVTREQERHTRFSAFTEITSGRFRPQQVVVISERGQTEIAFNHWTSGPPAPQLFTPVHLETQTLVLPATRPEG